MNGALDLQSRASLSYSLGFDPGPAYGRVMAGIKERVLMRAQEQRLIYQHGPRIFPEEFKEFQSVIRGQNRTDGHRERCEWSQK